jgi:hypothetical protein
MKRIALKGFGHNSSFGGVIGSQRIVGSHYDGDIIEVEDGVADCLIRTQHAFEVIDDKTKRLADDVAKQHRMSAALIEKLKHSGADITDELDKINNDLSTFEKSAKESKAPKKLDMGEGIK